MTSGVVTTLRSAAAVRERAEHLFALGVADRLPHFRIDLDRLPAVAEYVLEVIRESYPSLEVPIHGRFRHFAAGGIDRLEPLRRKIATQTPAERARIFTELVIVSVLLDAGAGPNWRYQDRAGPMQLARSEGLAVASFDLVVSGGLARDPVRALTVDGERLAGLTRASLGKAFQVSADNPLVGVDGRVALMHGLATVMAAQPDVFGRNGRLGRLFDHLASHAVDGRLPADLLLGELLVVFADVWPGRVVLDGINLGDVGRHTSLVTDDETNGLVPFHKLSQWLAYSLVEPLAEGGVEVTDLDRMTGLPEYRNGGLFIDLGVLIPRDPGLDTRALPPDSEEVVEWRALTVALLDRLAPLVREKLGLTAAQFPLARLLEGGTWSAGRQIALAMRPGGGPPLVLASDGTIF